MNTKAYCRRRFNAEYFSTIYG